MRQAITGFTQDEQQDWVALLSCGHRQHVRHKPPFFPRPWVTSEEGRAERIGTEVECPYCDEELMPEGFQPFKRTPTFTQDSVPEPLLRDHKLGPGVWGKLIIERGVLRYRVGEQVRELSPEQPGTIVSGLAHSVEPVGEVQFFVQFYRAPEQERDATALRDR